MLGLWAEATICKGNRRQGALLYTGKRPHEEPRVSDIIPAREVWFNYVECLRLKVRLRARKWWRTLLARVSQPTQDKLLSALLRRTSGGSITDKSFEKLPTLKGATPKKTTGDAPRKLP